MYEDMLYSYSYKFYAEYIIDPRKYFSLPMYCTCITPFTGIEQVFTLISDLSQRNWESDLERKDTPQGPFYRVYFEIHITLDGSELSAELICQGVGMGRSHKNI
jgi:hypothetical protein